MVFDDYDFHATDSNGRGRIVELKLALNNILSAKGKALFYVKRRRNRRRKT
jgi:hypothetical protein